MGRETQGLCPELSRSFTRTEFRDDQIVYLGQCIFRIDGAGGLETLQRCGLVRQLTLADANNVEVEFANQRNIPTTQYRAVVSQRLAAAEPPQGWVWGAECYPTRCLLRAVDRLNLLVDLSAETGTFVVQFSRCLQ